MGSVRILTNSLQGVSIDMFFQLRDLNLYLQHGPDGLGRR